MGGKPRQPRTRPPELGDQRAVLGEAIEAAGDPLGYGRATREPDATRAEHADFVRHNVHPLPKGDTGLRDRLDHMATVADDRTRQLEASHRAADERTISRLRRALAAAGVCSSEFTPPDDVEPVLCGMALPCPTHGDPRPTARADRKATLQSEAAAARDLAVPEVPDGG